MVGIAGQSVLLGIDSIVPTLNTIYPLQTLELRNGSFSYLNVTKNILNDMPTSIPVDWVSGTIMNCTFNTLQAGNLEYLSDNISKIIVKRKRVDAPYIDIDWTVLFEVPIEDQANLSFVVNDFTNIYGATYVYQLVPVIIQEQGGIQVEVEGLGQDSEEIESVFCGTFICDSETFVRLYAGVEYGNMQTTQITGIHQTLGGKYPIIVANSKASYRTGSIGGIILNEDYGVFNENTGEYGQLNRQRIVEARNKVEKFLINKKPKIIKDDNGNIWLVILTDNLDYQFFNEWGRGLGSMSVNWTEIGDPSVEADLKRTHILGGGVS